MPQPGCMARGQQAQSSHYLAQNAPSPFTRGRYITLRTVRDIEPAYPVPPGSLSEVACL